MQQVRSVLAAFAALTLAAAPVALGAAHGLDNNWRVSITGKKDANSCFKFVSVDDIKDVGQKSVTHEATNSEDKAKCVEDSGACTDDYDCEAAAAKKTKTSDGCEFNNTSAEEVEAEGILMDKTCYDNFIMAQKDGNGAPGLAPDKVHVLTEAELHTRACLLVNYCSGSGYYLVDKNNSINFEKVVQLDKVSGALVFDWLVRARHSCAPVAQAKAADVAAPMLACGVGAAAAALASS